MGCTLVCYYTVIVVQAVFWGLLVLELRRTRRILQTFPRVAPVCGACLICGRMGNAMWGLDQGKMICRTCVRVYSDAYAALDGPRPKIAGRNALEPTYPRPEPPPAPPLPPSQ